MDALMSTKPLNLKEFRQHIRFLYNTDPAVSQIIDVLAATTKVPEEIKNRFSPQQVAAILHEYWMFGWVVIDTVEPCIYDPGYIRVLPVPGEAQPRIFWITLSPDDEGEREITHHARLIARRTTPYDLLGQPIFGFLGDNSVQDAFVTSYENSKQEVEV